MLLNFRFLIGQVSLGNLINESCFNNKSSWRYGRKFVLILGTIGSGVFGILRIFASNYTQFAVFEFFDSFFGAATYSTSFIIGLELVVPKHRTVFGTCLNCFYAFGEIYLGIIAMIFRNYKSILWIAYLPSFLALAYICILPQSKLFILFHKEIH